MTTFFAYTPPTGYSALGGTLDSTTLGSGLSLDASKTIITCAASGWVNARSTAALTGKCYFEGSQLAGGNAQSGFYIGIGSSALTNTAIVGNATTGAALYNASSGQMFRNTTQLWSHILYGTFGVPIPIGLAIDIPNKLLYLRGSSPLAWFGSAGTAGGADPVAGTGGIDISSGVLGTTSVAFIGFFSTNVTTATGAFSSPAVASTGQFFRGFP